jgi:predicted DNA-binding transcriptional regulator YafY
MAQTGPTTRVLTVLERLQERPCVPGPLLAEELGVDGRTVRRYVAGLQELGIPIEATRGRYGGYRLLPGYRMPPLMFTTDEAVVLTLALMAMRRSQADDSAASRALGKLSRVLPRDLSDRISTVQAAISTSPGWELNPGRAPHPGLLVPLAEGVVARRRCRIRHRSQHGEITVREVDPYGVVALHGGWYVHGWCHLRQARRTFRIDRIDRVDVLSREFSAPHRLDVVAAVERSLALSRSEWPVTLLLHGAQSEVEQWIPRHLGVLESAGPDLTRMRSSTSNLDYFVLRVSDMPFDITVVEPGELRQAFARCADRMAGVAARGPGRVSHRSEGSSSAG